MFRHSSRKLEPRHSCLSITTLAGLAGLAGAGEGDSLLEAPLQALARRGVELEVFYVADSSWILSGGAERGDVHRSLFDVTLALDLNTLAGLSGARLGLDYYSRVGRDGSELAGDAQAFSNIDGPRIDELAELWYEQIFPHERWRLKLGKVDANSEFAFVETGQEFLNSSFGFSPTIVGLPTYPDPATSVNLFWSGDEGASLGLGVFDGSGLEGRSTGRHGLRAPGSAGDELFLIAELGLSYEQGLGGEAGRVALGLSHHTATLETFDGEREAGSQSGYLCWDQRLVRGEGPDAVGEVNGFLQLAHAPPAISAFETHLGLGATWKAPLAARPADLAGLAASWAFASSEAELDEPYELAIEAFWRLGIGAHLSLKPDLQYVVHPSAGGEAGDALVATIRIELSL